jgi:hypothetical protein
LGKALMATHSSVRTRSAQLARIALGGRPHLALSRRFYAAARPSVSTRLITSRRSPTTNATRVRLHWSVQHPSSIHEPYVDEPHQHSVERPSRL